MLLGATTNNSSHRPALQSWGCSSVKGEPLVHSVPVPGPPARHCVQPGSQEREAQRELQGTSLAQVPGTRNGGPGGEDSVSLALLLSEQLLGTNTHCLHRACPQGPRAPSSFGMTTHPQAPHAREPLPAPFHLPNALMPGAKHRQRVTEEKQLVFFSPRGSFAWEAIRPIKLSVHCSYLT